MSSTSDKISGKIKQSVGKMSNDKKLEAKGRTEETRGKIKSSLDQAVDKITSTIRDNK